MPLVNFKAASAFSGCPVSCHTNNITGDIALYTWQQKSILTTVTHATVIAVIDQQNHTSYTTKFNTDLGGFKPPNTTDRAGTVTAVTEYFDVAKSTVVNTTITYPTQVLNYPYELEFDGTLPTIAANSSTGCLRVPSTSPIDFAVPPKTTDPAPTTTVDPQDTYGWTYTLAVGGYNDSLPFSLLYPELAAFAGCSTIPAAAAAQAEGTALFTTVTSVSTSDGTLKRQANELLDQPRRQRRRTGYLCPFELGLCTTLWRCCRLTSKR